MSKKILAILMAVAMAFSLLPATALATTSGDDQQQSTLQPGAKYYNFNGTETTSENADITLTKTAAPVEREDDVYAVTLTATTSQKVTPKPVEVVFVLDGSGSMGWCTETTGSHYYAHTIVGGGWCSKTKKDHSKSRWNIAINAINQMVQNIGEDGVTYKYVLFNSDAEIVTSYDKNTEPEGYTYLTEGVEKGIATFSKNSGADKVMIIVADGESDDGYPAEQATAFKNAGGKIYTVGFLFSGNKFNNLSSGDGYHFTADNADQINLAMNTITQNIAGLISDPMGENVTLLQDNGISVKLGDQDTTPATVLNGNTIRWTKTDGFSGTVTMKYQVQVKDSAKTGKVLSIPLNGNATFNYVYNGAPHSVAFPQPAAQAATLTVSYKVGNKTVKTEEDYTLLGKTAAFTTTIPSVGDAVEIEGKTYYVSSTDGSVPEQLASRHYQVTVNLSETPPILGTVTVTVPNKTVTYDGTSQTGYTDTTSDLPNGYTLSATYTPAEGTDANAEGYTGHFGDVTITRNSDDADVTSRFTITTTPGKLIINKRAVTVKADNQSKVYGEDNPELTYKASGFVEGESLDTLGITPRLTTEAVKNSPVGSYPITFSNPTAETDNYTIKYENAILTIGTSQTLVGTVSLGDWKYGETKQTEMWNVSGGDNDYAAPTYSYKVKGAADDTYAPAKPSNAGEYTVKATWAKTDNCPEISATDDFTISKRNVTLTSATDSKPYDGKPLTNNKVTVDGDGFAQDEGATYHVTGTQTEPNESSPTSNTFTYELKEGTLQSNYNITKVEGTLTVTGSATVPVDLSKLIQKELKLEEESSLPQDATFKVTVTENNKDNPATITGETASTSDSNSWTVNGMTYTAPFNFTDLTLEKGKTYSYQVTEDKSDPVSGVEYDPTTYQLTITADMKGSYSASYTVAPTGDAAGTTSTEVSTTKPLTIKNTYQTPDLSVTKEPYKVKVNDTLFDADETVAHVGDTIVWKVSVKNNRTTPASTQLKDTLGDVKVYTDEALTQEVTLTSGTWTARVPAEQTVPYYVTYTVKADDIPNGQIVNTIVKDGDNNIPSAPVSTWDTKQLKSATSLKNTSDWTTTVTLTLPTVNENKAETTVATDNNNGNPVEEQPIIAISEGSYVIDQIGNEFTFMDGLSLEVGAETYIGVKDESANTYKFATKDGKTYPDTVTYTAKDGDTPAQFKWEIKENIPAGTKVTLSYKLELTTREKNPGTYGVEDLNGDNKTEPGKTPIYTNKSATLYKDKQEIAVFPKPSVSYTIKSSSGSHSGGSRPSLNTKDHYGYIIGYPVDYYTGQPTTDQTKKPVRPEGKITRAEVATIYFRMLTDESRTKFWSQSNSYSDVKAGDWFNNAVSTLSKAGIIAGYEDGSFRPNGYITRAEFATIAARFFDVTYNGKDLFPDISGHWAKDYINQAANKGFVNGYEDGTFKPDRNITRAEAVTLVNRTLDRHPDKNHFTKDMLVWPDNMDQTKWYYADMQEATNSHTYQMKENSDKTKYENWTKTLPIRNWEALEKAWSNANSSQGNGNVV